MNENVIYWLWLQRRIGPASRCITRVLEQPGKARFIYECGEEELWLLGGFPYGVIRRLLDKSLDNERETLDACRRLEYDILTPEDAAYPQRLLTTDDPPAALYVSGDISDVNGSLCTAIVGTRKATQRGAAISALLASRLTRAGCLVISGAAYGIDEAAHTGALNCGGRTLAVLGCGIDYRYNYRCESLREVISHHGALISEYPPGTPPSKCTFPIRNRLISGMSHAVVVVEAGLKSGSINTVGKAAAQNRDVFAVPAPEGLPNYEGVKKLIDDGAYPLTTANDLLEHYSHIFGSSINYHDECFLPLGRDVIVSGKLSATLNDLLHGGVYAYGVGALEEYSQREPVGSWPDYEGLFGADDSVPPNGIYVIDENNEVVYDGGLPERMQKAENDLDALFGDFIPKWSIPFPNGAPSQKKKPKNRKAAAPSAEKDAAERTPEDRKSKDEEREKRGTGISLPEEASAEAARLLALMPLEPRRAEELAELAKLPYRTTASLLTELELYGAVKMYSGKRYAPTGVYR